YRSDVGYVYDHAMSTKSNSNRFSVDLGFGSIFHGGVDLNFVTASTKNYLWLSENALKNLIRFKNSDSTFEGVYFKNPGEKTSTDQKYYNLLGDDKLVRVNLATIT